MKDRRRLYSPSQIREPSQSVNFLYFEANFIATAPGGAGRKLRIVSFVASRKRTPKRPQPESYDLRQKVIQAIKLDGLKIIEASQQFNISRCCVRPLGAQRQDETEDFLALLNQPPGNGYKITDWELCSQVSQNSWG
jgi:hypothetical protein